MAEQPAAQEQLAQQERFPALGDAEPVFDSSLGAPAPLARSHAAAPGSPMQQPVLGRGSAVGAAAWGATLTAGTGANPLPTDTDGTGAGWQPYGLWKQQKERLLQNRGQVAHPSSGIAAIWDQQQGMPGEQQLAAEQPGSGRAWAAAAGSPFTRHSSSGRGERVPALPAGSLTAAAEAAAVAASPMARSVRSRGEETTPQSTALHRMRPGAATRPSASPPTGAALFAAAAAAEVASPQQLPAAVAPSPAQLSPESKRFRQQFLPHELVPAPGGAAAGQERSGHSLSPGSQLQRRAAAAQATAVEELKMQRLISEQQLLERQAGQQAGAVPAAHAAPVQRQRTPTSRYAPQHQEQQAQASHVSAGVGSVTRYPQVQQQQQQQQAEQQQPTQEERMAAALISARLAQAEQVRAGRTLLACLSTLLYATCSLV